MHTNDNYAVVIDYNEDHEPIGYVVINSATGVPEFKDAQLANVIGYAEHANSFLVNELWKWVGVQGAKNKEALDKEDAVVTFEHDLDLSE